MSSSFAFPVDSTGPAIVRLLIASCLMSSLSVSTNLAFYYGSVSLWTCPAAWTLTLVHHIILYCIIPRRNQSSPHEVEYMPQCIKSALNIWSLYYLAFIWLAAGVITNLVVWKVFGFQRGINLKMALNIASGVAAVIEALLISLMCGLSWRALSKEGYRSSSRLAVHISSEKSEKSDESIC